MKARPMLVTAELDATWKLWNLYKLGTNKVSTCCPPYIQFFSLTTSY